MEDRVVVYIDSQNTYIGARDAFFGSRGLPTDGQYDPMRLAQRICEKSSRECSLEQVRVYTGRPSSLRDPKGYGANRRQCMAWGKAGVRVYARTLRYSRDPRVKPQEKGIDVQLAVDLVAGAVDGLYDWGVVVSTDTDILPAIEYVAGKFPKERTVEVAAWSSPPANRPLKLGGATMWCHFLDRDDFEMVRDDTVYVR